MKVKGSRRLVARPVSRYESYGVAVPSAQATTINSMNEGVAVAFGLFAGGSPCGDGAGCFAVPAPKYADDSPRSALRRQRPLTCVERSHRRSDTVPISLPASNVRTDAHLTVPISAPASLNRSDRRSLVPRPEARSRMLATPRCSGTTRSSVRSRSSWLRHRPDGGTRPERRGCRRCALGAFGLMLLIRSH